MVVQSLRRAALPWGSLAYCYDFISAHARECRDRAAAVQDSLVPGTVNRARRVQALHVAGGEFHRCLVKHLAGDRPEYARRCMPHELFHDEMIQFSDRTVFDPEALGARNADPIGFLDGLFTEAAAEGRSLMGFKHFAHLSSVVAQAAIADPATKLIHIRRGNFLAQCRRGERPEQVRINFDRDDFEAREQYPRRIECEWMNLFAFREGPRPCDAGAAFPVSWRGNRKRWGAAFPEAEYHSDLGSLQNRDEVTTYLAEKGLLHWGETG